MGYSNYLNIIEKLLYKSPKVDKKQTTNECVLAINQFKTNSYSKTPLSNKEQIKSSTLLHFNQYMKETRYIKQKLDSFTSFFIDTNPIKVQIRSIQNETE